ncbi:hypothetical protein GCM10022252_34290 [Streptosporangium oxazolinicum]|uniref:Uncharacterized protein n=1 Tax=Streptosporangium oxazolinicum TaxID=909287 RepID=A0ABP8AXD8_9ACTN
MEPVCCCAEAGVTDPRASRSAAVTKPANRMAGALLMFADLLEGVGPASRSGIPGGGGASPSSASMIFTAIS